MREPALTSSNFPTADCATCGKSVLTHLTYDETGASRRLCVHCDTPVDGRLRWVTAAELEAEGYLIGARASARTVGGCGCGSGGQCSARKH